MVRIVEADSSVPPARGYPLDNKKAANDEITGIKAKKGISSKHTDTDVYKGDNNVSTESKDKIQETSDISSALKFKNNVKVDDNIKARDSDIDLSAVASLSSPSTEEIKVSYSKSVTEIQKSTDDMFAPAKLSMAIMVIMLIIASLAQEFSDQLNREIVQTKAKVASIMEQKSQIEEQGIAKLTGGIVESGVTIAAAGANIVGSMKNSAEISINSKRATGNIESAQKKIDVVDKELSAKQRTLKAEEEELAKLKAADSPDKEAIKQRQVKIDKLHPEIEASSQTIEQHKRSIKQTIHERDTDLKKSDQSLSITSGFSQMIGSFRGLVTGGVDYYTNMKQANIKLQDAVQAGTQLNVENSKRFGQKAGDYLTQSIRAIQDLLISKYQAIKAIISS